MNYVLLIVIFIIVLFIIWIIMTYNKIIVLKNRVKDQWSQVDVELKKRFDLIPNLVEIVKGYAKHEKETLIQLVNARNEGMLSKNNQEEIEANDKLTTNLSKLLALVENYPELKANTNFIELQKALKDVEDKIGYARSFYNDSVLKYQNVIDTFPNVLVAKIFGFKKELFFEIENSERENIKIDL